MNLRSIARADAPAAVILIRLGKGFWPRQG
jgi:hypothetical protein